MSICLPSFTTAAAEVPAAAAQLLQGAADGTLIDTGSVRWQSLYFVTVYLQPYDGQGQLPLASSSMRSSGPHPTLIDLGANSQQQLSQTPCSHRYCSGRCTVEPTGAACDNAGSVILYDTLYSAGGGSSRGSMGVGSASQCASSHALSSKAGTSCRLSFDSQLLGSFSSVSNARVVCNKIEGLKIRNQIAAGSYGRVFRGDYFGNRVSRSSYL